MNKIDIKIIIDVLLTTAELLKTVESNSLRAAAYSYPIQTSKKSLVA